MITSVINNNIVELYDSIDNMPIVNFNLFNKYLLIDAGIGSEFSDIDAHIVKIAKFINHDKDMAIQELQNMRQLMYMISQGINPKHMAFGCFVHSVNGTKFFDLTDSGITKLLERFKGEKIGLLNKLFEKLKKKSMKN